MQTALLPKEIWEKIASELDVHSLWSLSQVSQLFYHLTFTSPHPHLWRKYLKNTLIDGDHLEERLQTLDIKGEDPARFLFKKMKGKFLLLSNRNYIKEKMISTFQKFLPKATIMGLAVQDTPDEDYGFLLDKGFDAVLIVTNYGWPSLAVHGELGNVMKKLIDSGVGVVTTVYVGCSWLESLGGEFHSQQCLGILPNVWENNVPGSQDDLFHPTISYKINNHFLMFKDSGGDVTISLGKPHPEGEVIANFITESNEEVPFIVVLKKFNGKIVSLNTYFEVPYYPLVLLSMLFVSKIN
eukprot:TRINITY_DN20009_c0_g1_i1.p1 TRINITY_DN20009_c0_g1~~TRINITY_DN20009_c0_g1_i1.p1  ORF type:complete len:297 (-),score=77.64 TRINITY_DN20009_c0_g1_i1:13-903(-)